MYEIYQKIVAEHKKELDKAINEDYKSTEQELEILVEKAVNETGKKEREANKLITSLVLALWLRNGKSITKTSKALMNDTWLFYEFIAAQKLNVPSTILTNKQISKMVDKIYKERCKMIKWDKVLNGNARRTNRKIKNIVKQGLKKGKTTRQIQADIQKRMKIDRNKAKMIADNEVNFYRAETKIQVAKHQTDLTVIKTWIYTFRSKEPRVHHKRAGESHQVAIGVYGLFEINGHKTIAPQHFGIASEDINCKCDYKMEYAQEVNTTQGEFNKYKEGKNE